MTTRIFSIFLIALFTLSCAASESTTALSKGPNSKQKSVLVTGASTGIGRKIAERLASEGFYVYAGARKQRDLDDLNKLENVQAIRLDVTVQSEIDDAVNTIQQGGGLFGLVNNAGVAIVAPLIEVDESDVQWLFDVNVLGPLRITQAFAPMIIEAKGRITTIGSISGILSGSMMGPYSMSKHAVEAYTDSLASEMERFGVSVSVIEPGNYRSNIVASAMKKSLEKESSGVKSRYEKDLSQVMKGPSDRSQFKEPDDVAEAALHALRDANPKRRYMVVPNQREASWTINKAIQEVVELNAYHEYSYSREQLIEMLDSAMTKTDNQ